MMTGTTEYCLVAHGQAVRRLSGDPELGEMLVMNYRVAALDPRQHKMLDFAWKLTTAPATIGEEDRMASGLDIIPKREYHRWDR